MRATLGWALLAACLVLIAGWAVRRNRKADDPDERPERGKELVAAVAVFLLGIFGAWFVWTGGR